MIKQLNFISPTGAPIKAWIGNKMFTLVSIDGFTSVDSDLSQRDSTLVDGDTGDKCAGSGSREITLYLQGLKKQDVGIELTRNPVCFWAL